MEIPFPPMRIVSLVPSQTELLYDLGLGDRVVGITKFCIHPEEWRKQKTIIGGTKSYHFDKIELLKPDLIIGNKEENDQEQIELLQERYPVWMSDIFNLDDALRMIASIGELTNTSQKAMALGITIKKGFSALPSNAEPKRTAYFIWRKPYMVAGGNTFIDNMLQRSGLINVFQNKGRYPVIDLEDIKHKNPEVILLSSEPYPFKNKHLEEIKEVCPNTEVLLVDGELFSWYGSRLIKSVSYFQELLSRF